MSEHITVTEEQVVEQIKKVFDPEIPVNIYELGLVYEIQIVPINSIHIQMTLTSPACPVAGTLPVDVENKVKEIEGVRDAHVTITFDPPWTQDMMSEAAKLELGFM
jgi:FeS assembly SUF system protein